jgi:hypothetical protein
MNNSQLKIKGALLAATIVFTANTFAQSFSDSLISVLKKKNFQEATTFLDGAKNKNIRMVLNRQIVNNYFEVLYEIRDGKGEQIKLLCDADKIIYAKVVSSEQKKFEEQDSAAIKHFYKNYTAFFEAKIKVSDFFVDNLQYGRGCGFAGVDPPLKKETVKLVAAKNVKELTKLLQSPVTEKQLYGVEGFISLQEKGYALTHFQKKLIDFIKIKKGKAKTCSGCIYSDKEISTIFEGKK